MLIELTGVKAQKVAELVAELMDDGIDFNTDEDLDECTTPIGQVEIGAHGTEAPVITFKIGEAFYALKVHEVR